MSGDYQVNPDVIEGNVQYGLNDSSEFKTGQPLILGAVVRLDLAVSFEPLSERI